MDIIVKPKPGLTVRKPDGSKLQADGERVSRTSFWIRRLQDGDVTEVKQAAKAAKNHQPKE